MDASGTLTRELVEFLRADEQMIQEIGAGDLPRRELRPGARAGARAALHGTRRSRGVFLLGDKLGDLVIESRCSTPASWASTMIPKCSSRKTTSFRVVIESRMPPVMRGVRSVNSVGVFAR